MVSLRAIRAIGAGIVKVSDSVINQVEGVTMEIMKFGILETGDKVMKVDGPVVHVQKANGEYFVYTLILDKGEQIIDFNVFAIKIGMGSIEAIKDADLNDLAEAWRDSNE